MHGLAIAIKDKEGNVLEDNNKKIDALKRAGMSANQFQQIVDDITSLTKWTEEAMKSFLE